MPTLSFSVSVIRPQDLLVLTFDFRNVDFTPPVGSTPGQIAGQAGAILVAHFQPQHIAEQAFTRSPITPAIRGTNRRSRRGGSAPCSPGPAASSSPCRRAS